MKKISITSILLIPFLGFSQTKDTTEFKMSGNLLKQKYTATYSDSLMMDSSFVVSRLNTLQREFLDIQNEINNQQEKRQKKKREHNRLLIEAKKKWAINKTAL